MRTAVITKSITESSPRVKARMAGVCYSPCFVTGIFARFVRSRLGFASGLTAGACYFAATLLLIGYLIFRSTFLPRILGALMAFAGLGWLTFVSARLATYLSPHNMHAGIIGEGTLTLRLLVMGVNEQRWKEQASFVGRRG